MTKFLQNQKVEKRYLMKIKYILILTGVCVDIFTLNTLLIEFLYDVLRLFNQD